MSIDLYAKMMAALAIQDLTFLLLQPTPVAVLTAPTFDECAKLLGLNLEIDEDGSRTTTVARPNLMLRGRFDNDSAIYLKLRVDMEQLLAERDVTVADYITAERKASGHS